MHRINCAIYVRKSTEKGLELEFNSLHNQEEACKSYISSQAYSGWEYYQTYTDGGISGGTMNRPELKRMLDDMKKGLVQMVVVYKLDRLSRSIMDFHHMMKEFEKYGCNFVSITQAFDTSTSMGKLTLNMLLSFAQFEREVSSERVRDKLAASREKGFWTGGPPPLGYDVREKKLIPNPQEAEQVRFIFEKYLELQSLSGLREYLAGADIRGKQWTTQTGEARGGGKFCSSMLSRLLRSKVYIGMIESKKNKVAYPGKHEPIIGKKLFDEVQALMDDNQNKHTETHERDKYLLSGKLFNSNGTGFVNQKSCKKRKKYRYYALKGTYLSAGDIEDITVQVIRSILDYPLGTIIDKGQAMEFKSVDFEDLTNYQQCKLIRLMIDKIIHHNNMLTYFIKLDDLTYLKAFKKNNYLNTNNTNQSVSNKESAKGSPLYNLSTHSILELDGKIYTSNDRTHIVIEREIRIADSRVTTLYVGKNKRILSTTENHHTLVKALSLSWRYGKLVAQGLSIKSIEEREEVGDRTIYRYLSLCYLSPTIVNAIMDGKIPPHVNLQVLFKIASHHTDFKDQEREFYISF